MTTYPFPLLPLVLGGLLVFVLSSESRAEVAWDAESPHGGVVQRPGALLPFEQELFVNTAAQDNENDAVTTTWPTKTKSFEQYLFLNTAAQDTTNDTVITTAFLNETVDYTNSTTAITVALTNYSTIPMNAAGQQDTAIPDIDVSVLGTNGTNETISPTNMQHNASTTTDIPGNGTFTSTDSPTNGSNTSDFQENGTGTIMWNATDSPVPGGPDNGTSATNASGSQPPAVTDEVDGTNGTRTVWAILQKTPETEWFRQALTNAGLNTFLQNQQIPVTVFVPPAPPIQLPQLEERNQVLPRLFAPISRAQALEEREESRSSAPNLGNHIFPGTVWTLSILQTMDGQSIRSVNGARWVVSVLGDNVFFTVESAATFVETAAVAEILPAKSDQLALNGVVHQVDAPLVQSSGSAETIVPLSTAKATIVPLSASNNTNANGPSSLNSSDANSVNNISDSVTATVPATISPETARASLQINASFMVFNTINLTTDVLLAFSDERDSLERAFDAFVAELVDGLTQSQPPMTRYLRAFNPSRAMRRNTVTLHNAHIASIQDAECRSAPNYAAIPRKATCQAVEGQYHLIVVNKTDGMARISATYGKATTDAIAAGKLQESLDQHAPGSHLTIAGPMVTDDPGTAAPDPSLEPTSIETTLAPTTTANTDSSESSNMDMLLIILICLTAANSIGCFCFTGVVFMLCNPAKITSVKEETEALKEKPEYHGVEESSVTDAKSATRNDDDAASEEALLAPPTKNFLSKDRSFNKRFRHHDEEVLSLDPQLLPSLRKSSIIFSPSDDPLVLTPYTQQAAPSDDEDSDGSYTYDEFRDEPGPEVRSPATPALSCRASVREEVLTAETDDDEDQWSYSSHDDSDGHAKLENEPLISVLETGDSKCEVPSDVKRSDDVGAKLSLKREDKSTLNPGAMEEALSNRKDGISALITGDNEESENCEKEQTSRVSESDCKPTRRDPEGL